MKISIIVPVYNLEKVLERGINSVLNQTFTDYELILINDGSTDNSIDICYKLKNKDKRIKVINKKNEGSGPTRNLGIDTAIGEYIVFFDGDDLMEVDMLSSLYNKAVQGFDLVVTNYNIIHNNDIISKSCDLSEDYSVLNKLKCRETCIDLMKAGLFNIPWNKIYKSEIIKNEKIYFPDLRRGQDAIFNIRYFNCICNYSVLKLPLYNYFENTVDNQWRKYPKDCFEISYTIQDEFEKFIKKWDVYGEDYKLFLSNYFINDTIICITNSFNPDWHFNFRMQYNYIKKLVEFPRTRESIIYYNPLNLYKKIIKLFIKNKNILCIMVIINIFIFIKGKFNNIYKILYTLLKKQ